MKSILLFGSTTETGKYLKKVHGLYFKNINFYEYSRKNKNALFLNLKSFKFPKEMQSEDEFYIVSLAPIWLFVPFLEKYLKKNNASLIKGITITSSTSSITKRYSWNRYDKKLSRKLLFWEEKLFRIQEFYNLDITLIRPTLIYGNLGENNDKNISILIKTMRNWPFIPIPKNTGMRQPIHFSQLAECILKIIKNKNNENFISKKLEILNLGGDDELTYYEILKRIKTYSKSKDRVKNCLILKIPNRLFFLIFLPFLIVSPKFFEALERLAIDLNGFTKANEITGNTKQFFPIKLSIKK